MEKSTTGQRPPGEEAKVQPRLTAEQTDFVLSPEQWQAFCAALDAPPRDIPALRKLLTERGAFDERAGR